MYQEHMRSEDIAHVLIKEDYRTGGGSTWSTVLHVLAAQEILSTNCLYCRAKCDVFMPSSVYCFVIDQS